MTIEENIFNCIRTTSLGNDIYSSIADDSKAPPYAVYTKIIGQRPQTLDGDSGLERARFQIDIYASTSAQRAALRTEVRQALQADAVLKAIFLEDGETWEPDTKLYRSRQDFSFWFNS